jgi:hypothetical protein
MAVTKEQLDRALEAWQIAKDRAILEQKAWGTLTQNHGALISSLRALGHGWASAEAEFEKLSEAHREALVTAFQAMDERCTEYQKLRATFLGRA